jgi:hypothetical protein
LDFRNEEAMAVSEALVSRAQVSHGTSATVSHGHNGNKAVGSSTKPAKVPSAGFPPPYFFGSQRGRNAKDPLLEHYCTGAEENAAQTALFVGPFMCAARQPMHNKHENEDHDRVKRKDRRAAAGRLSINSYL